MPDAATKPAAAPARILAVGLERALFERIDPLLSRSLFAVDRVPRGESGVILAGQVRFDLVIVRHPLPDVSLELFLAALHRPGSASGKAPLLVFADQQRLAEARQAIGGGPAQVIASDEPMKLLEEVASRLLGVVPRVSSRLLIRLEVQLAQGKTLMMCQSENVSEGGMLLRTDRLHPVGTRVAFEVTPPGERTPIQGEAAVARHTVVGTEGVLGIGLKILNFKIDGKKRFTDFVARSQKSS
jgi:uncharacterized protein (TIGR02266 family)